MKQDFMVADEKLVQQKIKFSHGIFLYYLDKGAPLISDKNGGE